MVYEDNGQLCQEVQKATNENFLDMIGEDSENFDQEIQKATIWDMLGEDAKSGDKLISLNKACEWLENNLPKAMVRSDCYMFNGEFIEDFKKAMK